MKKRIFKRTRSFQQLVQYIKSHIRSRSGTTKSRVAKLYASSLLCATNRDYDLIHRTYYQELKAVADYRFTDAEINNKWLRPNHALYNMGRTLKADVSLTRELLTSDW